MKKTIRVVSILDATQSYEYIDEKPIQGGVKDVYFSPERDYVVAFYRNPLEEGQKERIRRIVSTYLQSIQNGNASGYFLNEIFRWPYDIVEKNKLTGIVVPIYPQKFFFAKGYIGSDNIRGEDKVGKWFTAPMFRNQQYPLRLDPSELGTGSAIFRFPSTSVAALKNSIRWDWPIPICHTIIFWWIRLPNLHVSLILTVSLFQNYFLPKSSGQLILSLLKF